MRLYPAANNMAPTSAPAGSLAFIARNPPAQPTASVIRSLITITVFAHSQWDSGSARLALCLYYRDNFRGVGDDQDACIRAVMQEHCFNGFLYAGIAIQKHLAQVRLGNCTARQRDAVFIRRPRNHIGLPISVRRKSLFQEMVDHSLKAIRLPKQLSGLSRAVRAASAEDDAAAGRADHFRTADGFLRLVQSQSPGGIRQG